MGSSGSSKLRWPAVPETASRASPSQTTTKRKGVSKGTEYLLTVVVEKEVPVLEPEQFLSIRDVGPRPKPINLEALSTYWLKA